MGLRNRIYIVVALSVLIAPAACSNTNPAPAVDPTPPRVAADVTFVPPRPAGTSVVLSTTPIPLPENKARLVLRDFVQAADEQRWTITNQGDAPANLGDWIVVTGAKTRARKPLPATTLAPGQQLVVHTKQGEDTATDFYLGFEADLAPVYWVPGDPVGGKIEIRSRDEKYGMVYTIPVPSPAPRP